MKNKYAELEAMESPFIGGMMIIQGPFINMIKNEEYDELTTMGQGYKRITGELYDGKTFGDYCNYIVECNEYRFKNSIENDGIGSAISIIEKPYRLQYLFNTLNKIPANKQAEAVEAVWVSIEGPGEGDYNSADLLGLFGCSGFPKTEFGDDAMVDVYRGVIADEVNTDDLGLSFTLDKEKAEWFATRFGDDNGKLIKATIKVGNIKAYFECRGEKEVIIDQDDLLNIEIIEL